MHVLLQSFLEIEISDQEYYDGVDAEKLNVTIDTVDQSTGKVFGTVNYPEAFEDME